MALVELSQEETKALFESKKETRQTISHTCSRCNSKLDNGYCRNIECSVDMPIAVFPCEVCGFCSTPQRCVSSVVCPVCESSVSSLCFGPGGRLIGYHEERWELVRKLYNTYYK